ncbi:hypothetical protein, partial [Devosia chinhatensis]
RISYDASPDDNDSATTNGARPVVSAVAAPACLVASGVVAVLQAVLASKLVSLADLGLGLPSNIKLDKLLSFGIDAKREELVELDIGRQAQSKIGERDQLGCQDGLQDRDDA